ncbi:MAG: hypothetical protein L3K26_17295 [Candidatus Hydrogenedentes bacterium]|nr:hypothetical protein [Candidatus Hydrogenedentota bacterium]
MMKFSIFIAGITILSLAGCETTPFKRSDDPPVELLNDKGEATAPVAEPGLTPAMARRFKDVPLPSGLREDTEQTFVFDSKATQVARMVYYTKDSLRDLAQFFIKRAPEEGWKVVSTTQVDDSVNLLFAKTGRRMDVNINRQGVGRSNRLVILYLPEADGS